MRLCVYCGSWRRRFTRDHVLPRCLFDRPLPRLLIAPACASCNAGWSGYESYLAGVARALPANASEPPPWVNMDRLAPVARKLVFGCLLRRFGGPGYFGFDQLGSVRLIFSAIQTMALPTAECNWRVVQPGVFGYATYREAGMINCTVSVRNVLWIAGSCRWPPPRLK